jgi:hypothetical protein
LLLLLLDLLVARVVLPPPPLLLPLLNAKREDAFTDDFQRCWRLLTLSAIKMNAKSRVLLMMLLKVRT